MGKSSCVYSKISLVLLPSKGNTHRQSGRSFKHPHENHQGMKCSSHNRLTEDLMYKFLSDSLNRERLNRIYCDTEHKMPISHHFLPNAWLQQSYVMKLAHEFFQAPVLTLAHLLIVDLLDRFWFSVLIFLACWITHIQFVTIARDEEEKQNWSYNICSFSGVIACETQEL